MAIGYNLGKGLDGPLRREYEASIGTSLVPANLALAEQVAEPGGPRVLEPVGQDGDEARVEAAAASAVGGWGGEDLVIGVGRG